MGNRRQPKSSDLFLVRLWASETGDGETEWRGKVQRAVSGEAYYFDALPQLPDLLRSMVPGHKSTDLYSPDPGLVEVPERRRAD